MGFQRFQNFQHAVAGGYLQPGGHQTDIAHAVLAVGLVGKLQLLEQHLGAADVHRRLVAAGPLDGGQGVGGRLVGVDVAGYGGEEQDLVPFVVEGHGDGHGVVRAAVGVDDDLAFVHWGMPPYKFLTFYYSVN